MAPLQSFFYRPVDVGKRESCETARPKTCQWFAWAAMSGSLVSTPHDCRRDSVSTGHRSWFLSDRGSSKSQYSKLSLITQLPCDTAALRCTCFGWRPVRFPKVGCPAKTGFIDRSGGFMVKYLCTHCDLIAILRCTDLCQLERHGGWLQVGVCYLAVGHGRTPIAASATGFLTKKTWRS